MCSNQAIVNKDICDLQDERLDGALRSIFAGEMWAQIRQHYRGQTDLQILRKVIEREARYYAVLVRAGGPDGYPVVCQEDQFRRK